MSAVDDLRERLAEREAWRGEVDWVLPVVEAHVAEQTATLRLTVERWERREAEVWAKWRAAETERNRLAATVARAEAVHRPGWTGMPVSFEASCLTCHVPWPCPTIAALVDSGQALAAHDAQVRRSERAKVKRERYCGCTLCCQSTPPERRGEWHKRACRAGAGGPDDG